MSYASFVLELLSCAWFAALTVQFAFTIIFAIQVQWALLDFCKFVLKAFMPFYAIYFIWLAFKTHSTWKKLFSWKIWFPLTLSLIIFSLTQWRFDPLRNFQTEVLGLSWQWSAIIQWSTLFIVQLCIYQWRKVDRAISFILSFLGVFIAASIFEIPELYRTNALMIEYLLPPFTVLTAIITYIVTYWRLGGCRLNVLVLGSLPISLTWFTMSVGFTYQDWYVRLGTFPLFIILPLYLGERVKK